MIDGLYLPASTPDEATEAIALTPPPPEPGREPLRHILLGSRQGVEAAVKQLQVLHYAEQFRWSRELVVPATGLVITPHQGEVWRYLLRWRSLE